MRVSITIAIWLAGCSGRSTPPTPSPASIGPYARELATDEPVAHFRIRGSADSPITTTDVDGAQSFHDRAIALDAPREVETDALTIESWVRVHTVDADVLAFGTGDTRLVLGVRGGKLHGTVRGEQVVTALPLETDAWHHVAITLDARRGELAIVLDGTGIAETTLTARTPLARGSRVFAGGAGRGEVDEVAIYERALAPSRLLSHVLVARGIRPPTLATTTAVELRPQRGHRGRVSKVAVTPDRTLALSSDDDELKLWDVTSGRELRSVPRTVLAGARSIDPTGRFALVRKLDGGGAVMELATAIVQDLPPDKEFVGGTFTPDGRRLVTTSKNVDALVTVREVGGRELGRIKAAKNWTVDALVLSPDGQWLAFKSYNWLRSVRNLNLVRVDALTKTVALETTQLYLEDARDLYAMAFLEANRQVAVLVCEGQNPHSDCHQTSVRVFDVDSRAELRRVAIRFGTLGQDAVASDNKHLLAFGSGSQGVEVWDLSTDKRVAQVMVHAPTGSSAENYKWLNPGVRTIALAGGTLLSAGDDGGVMASTFPTLRPIRTMARPLPDVEKAAVSRDGSHLVVATRNGVHRWDVGKLMTDRRVRHQLEKIGALALSADGKRALVAGSVELWPRELPSPWRERWAATPALGLPTVGAWQILELDTKQRHRLVHGHIVNSGGGWPTVIAAAFSDDGQWVATGDATGDLKAWPVAVPEAPNNFPRAPIGTSLEMKTSERWTAVAVTRDGALVAGATGSGRLHIAASPSNRAKDFGYFAEVAGAVAGIDSGKPIANLAFDGDVLTATTAGGERLSWRVSVDPTTPAITATPLVAGAAPPPAPIDLATVLGSPVRELVDDHGGRLHGAIMADQTVAVWSRDPARAVRLAAVDDRWIAYAKDGTFDASIDGADLVAMVVGTKAFGIDQFAVQFNRPDRLLANLEIARPDLVAHFAAQHERRARKAGFTEQTLPIGTAVPRAFIAGTEVAGPTATLTIQLASELELATYNVFVNDVPVHLPPGKRVQGKRARIVEAIELSAGANKIEVVAVDQRGIESYRALTFAQRDGTAKGDLYVLTFGVSKYRDSSLDLSFASKDARDLAGLLRRASGFARVHVRSYEDAQVTVPAIRDARAFLANAKVDDTFVLAIMGHGVHDRDPAATYYFVTHEADIDRLAQTSASFELVEGLLYGIAPRRKLFLMDTCESGELEPNAERAMADAGAARQLGHRGLVRVKGAAAARAAPPPPRPYIVERDRFVFLDLARRSGAIVFSSSRGGELSYEDDKLEHGVFTHAVIDALSSQDADADRDGWLSVTELRTRVETQVERHTYGLQHPTIDRDNIAIRFGLPVIPP